MKTNGNGIYNVHELFCIKQKTDTYLFENLPNYDYHFAIFDIHIILNLLFPDDGARLYYGTR